MVRSPSSSVVCLSPYSSRICCSSALDGTTWVPSPRARPLGRPPTSVESAWVRRRNTVPNLLRDDRTSGLEAGDRHPERRARDVVEPDLFEEMHRVGIAAVFAADAQFEA